MDIIDPRLYAAFLGLSTLLIVSPGPSVLLIVATSLQYGLRTGLTAVAGTNLGLLIALLLAGAGLEALRSFAAGAFEVARWLGVLYLAGMGLNQLRQARDPVPASGRASARPFWTGLVVSLVNPATTPFFIAWLPQFIDGTRPFVPQYVLLGGSFLVLAATLDTLWVLLSARLKDVLRSRRALRIRLLVSGGLLVACAILLALYRAP